MSKSVLTALAISAGALGAQAWPGPLSTQDLDREPERAYTLILDGKEVALQPGQEVRMPVLYFVDPKALDDPNMDGVEQITLSYTFHRALESAE